MKEQITRVKLLQNSLSTKKNNGFVISLDTFFGIILLLGVISYLGMGMLPTEQSSIAITTQTNAKQMLDDAITAMDNQGFIGKILADESSELTDAQAQKIYERLKEILPSNLDANVKITRFEPADDLADCKSTNAFEDCFKSTPPPETAEAGEPFPSGNEIFYGTQLFMKRQPYIKGVPENTCILESQLAGKKEITKKETIALFDSEPAITTKVDVNDNAGNAFSAANKMQCYDTEAATHTDNEIAKVKLSEKSGIRQPVAIMLAMDRSGSMAEYDALGKQSGGSFDSGKCKSEPIWVAGKYGGGLEFDGNINYVDCGLNQNLNSNSEITISAWVKIKDPNKNAWERIVSKKSRYYDAGGYDLKYNPYLNEVRIHGGGDNSANATNVDLDTGWHHIAATISGSTGQIYVDGINKTTDSSLTPLALIAYSFAIGSYDSGLTSNYFFGTLDEIRIYNRALNETEILNLYNNSSIPTNGQKAYWTLNETSGLIAYDSSGNNVHCALKNWSSATEEPKWVQGIVSNGLSFDGLNSYVEVSNSGSLQVNGNLTLSFWIRPDNLGKGRQNPIDKAYGGEYAITTETDGSLNFYHGSSGIAGGNYRNYTWANILQNGGWTHVTITRDNAAHIVKLYKDGVLQTPSNTTSWVNPAASSLPVRMGKGYTAGSSSGALFLGMLDEIRLYNRALDATEIPSLVNNSSPPTNGLAAYWALNETSGNTAADSSGNNNNGTLYNWTETAEGACYYTAGKQEQQTTNCPANKAYYSQFTNSQKSQYDITGIFNRIGSGDCLWFTAVSTPYNGACILPEANMRLWLKRPDGAIEARSQSGYATTEDVCFANPPETSLNGIYDVNVWSDAPINYYVYLYQIINHFNDATNYNVSNGSYTLFETQCTNLGNWQQIKTINLSDYNQIYYTRFRPWYGNYKSIGGQCGSPRFQVRYTSSGSEWVQGKVGNALSFGGANRKNYVSIPPATSLNVQNLTFTTWFKSGRTSYWTDYPAIFMRGNNAGGNELFIGFDYRSQNVIRVALDGTTDSSGSTFSGSSNLWDTTWHHLAVTYDSTNLKVYVDGAQYGSTVTTSKTLDFGDSNAWIGADADSLNGSLGNYWYGSIDETRLYNTALTAGEISQIYSTELAGTPSNIAPGFLAAYWALNENSGYAAADSSGNSNNGTASLDQVWDAGLFGTGDNSVIDLYTITNGITGPYLAAGNYELWAWSDVPTTVKFPLYYANQYWELVFGNYSQTDTLQGGTCNNQPCGMTLVPATEAYTNCPKRQDYKLSYLPSAENGQLLGTFEMSGNKKGLRVDVNFNYINDPSASCTSTAAGFQNPIDGSNDPNWQYVFSNMGTSILRTWYVNAPSPNPVNCSYYCWSSAVPVPAGDYNVLGWAEKNTNYDINWYLQRIDASVGAAETFIKNTEGTTWKSTDQMGITSYSDNAILNAPLTNLDSEGQDLLVNSINSLTAGGETNIGNAIELSKQQLESTTNEKYVVLLSDGKANRPNQATAVAYAIQKGNEARNAGITIYTIGFGIAAAATDLKDIAKDPCSAYDDSGNCTSARMDGSNPKYPDCLPYYPSLTINLEAHCGRYYFATDKQQLQEIYSKIAQEIGTAIPGTKIVVNPEQGMELCDCEADGVTDCQVGECDADSPGWTTDAITFKEVNISGGFASQYYKARLPCNGGYCDKSTVEFPPTGTYPAGTYIEKDGTVYEWGNQTETECDAGCTGCTTNCTKTVGFVFRDLGIYFTDGTTSGTNAILKFDINNNSAEYNFLQEKLDNLEIKFYKNETTPANQLNVVSCGTINPANGICTLVGAVPPKWISWDSATLNSGTKATFTGTTINGVGYITVVISGVSECPLHNESTIYCLGDSKVYYFRVEYSAWVK